jgi:hypothetical protein
MTINKNSVQGDWRNGKKIRPNLEKVAKKVAKKMSSELNLKVQNIYMKSLVRENT